MSWQLLALVFSFFGAALIHANHVFKVDGFVLVFLRAFFVAGFGLPLFLFLSPPTQPGFYMWAALTGVVITLADVLLFNAANHHGGRLTSLYIPIKIFMVFVLWSVVDPTSFLILWETPLLLAGVLGCFVLTALALFYMRSNDASWSALLAILPVALSLTLADVFAKHAIAPGSVVAGAVMFLIVNGLVSSVLSALWLKFKRRENLAALFTKTNLTGAAVVGGLLLVGVSILLSAFVLSPNPAYAGAIAVLSVVWLTIFYKITHGDDASLKASMVLVLSAVGLILLTA
jgi:hypothetical protein